MTQNQIMHRLEQLERKVSDMQQQLASGRQEGKTWRDYIGMFKDDPDFKQAVEYGARYRRSLRPKPARKAPKQ